MPSIATAKSLPRRFYLRDVHVVAKELLNKTIVVGSCSARITEVEAYEGENDPASHAFRGMTARNEVMFQQGGYLYVYFTYGMHFCMNVVTGESGRARAVLLRSGEPITGLAVMSRRRGDGVAERDLCRGPARLTQALGIGRSDNGADLTKKDSRIRIVDGGIEVAGVRTSSRIGIKVAQDRPWRYYVNSPFVSAKR